MAKRFRKSDVETHCTGCAGPQLPAVNVKVYGSWWDMKLPGEDQNPHFTREWIDEHLSEDAINYWWEEACGFGWEQIRAEAREIFGSHVLVWAEGRSGGWAVVDGLPPIESWDAIMVGKWARFARFARAEADDVPHQTAYMIYHNVFQEWVAT